MLSNRDSGYPESNLSLPAGRSPGGRTTYTTDNAFDRVKAAVDIAEYASAQGIELKPAGNTMRGRCPLHGGDSASAFTVYPAEGTWTCFRGCGGGSVIDLRARLHGDHAEPPWPSMLALAEEYGVELPERSPSWRARRGMKNDARARAEEAVTERLQRRLWKVLCRPYVVSTPLETDEQEAMRREDAEELWATCGAMAREMRRRKAEEAARG